jgi:ABC-type multidrug transport system ATPase subunit
MKPLPSAIEISRLSKSFDSNRALRGIDLRVRQGETLAVFGPNGAGKTTLIKLLATLLSPSSGTIRINGLAIKERPAEIRREIGVVLGHTFLYPGLTALENLVFYGRMFDVPNPKSRAEEAAERMGISHRLHDKTGSLSRGMQQRLSIARALLHQPSILLLDEPETGLDQQGISLLWQALRSREKRTIVHTSHNLEMGLATCDRFIIMDRGKIAAEKPAGITLEELRTAYDRATGAVR